MSDQEPSELIVEWQGHAGTEWFAETLRAQVANAMTNLIGAARLSSDPKVTAAMMYVDTLNRVLMTVTVKPELRGDDEDQPIDETER